MLMLKAKTTLGEILEQAAFPFVLLPSPDKSTANEIAVDARIAGLGVTVLSGAYSQEPGLFVMATSDAGQIVGFARKVVAEHKADWFVFYRPNDAVKENSDRSREKCSLDASGLNLPDGRQFVCDGVFRPAQYNTALMASRGFNVGERL
jgi:hypothetical protein